MIAPERLGQKLVYSTDREKTSVLFPSLVFYQIYILYLNILIETEIGEL